MHRCLFLRCPGHNDQSEAILHGQEQLFRLLIELQRQLGRVEHDEEHTMSAVDDLVTVAAAAVDALNKLEALVQAGQADNPQVVQVVNDLRAAVDQAATIDGDNPPSAPTDGDGGSEPAPAA